MVERVGEGRMGEVWLARWRGENVAVKVRFIFFIATTLFTKQGRKRP